MPARFLTVALLFITAGTALAVDQTVWNGVYTTAQAARGESTYTAECGRCHRADLSGYGGVLVGDRFMNDWREDTVDSFFTLVKSTMPRNAPGSLTDAGYLDILAYVLQVNDFPAGPKELTLDTMSGIRIQGKSGAAPVPDFALVQVVGCLTQRPDGEWLVTNATEPVRTRDPKESAPAQVKALAGSQPGTHSFRLLDPSSLGANPPKNQRVEAKGLLIRKPGDDRLNPTSLQSVAPACAH